MLLLADLIMFVVNVWVGFIQLIEVNGGVSILPTLVGTAIAFAVFNRTKGSSKN